MDRTLKARLRKDPAVARIIRDWRLLTGGAAVRDKDRPTLIACSGGCDSSALALALAAASSNHVLAHIVHDMRPRRAALADRNAAKRLAERLGLAFEAAEISPKALAGNAEANARTLRYAALASIARERRCTVIATAHHADDRAETILMRILRGASIGSLASLSRRRWVRGEDGEPVLLIRPMLAVRRADAERICGIARWTWREDATNTDATRLRAAVRTRVLPLIESMSPGATGRLAALAFEGEQLSRIADRLADRALAGAQRSQSAFRWARRELKPLPLPVLMLTLRRAALSLSDQRGADALTRRSLLAAARAIRDEATHPRTFTWKHAEVAVRSRTVGVIAKRPTASPRG